MKQSTLGPVCHSDDIHNSKPAKTTHPKMVNKKTGLHDQNIKSHVAENLSSTFLHFKMANKRITIAKQI